MSLSWTVQARAYLAFPALGLGGALGVVAWWGDRPCALGREGQRRWVRGRRGRRTTGLCRRERWLAAVPSVALALVLVGGLLLASSVHGADRAECGLPGLVERGAVVRVEAVVGSDPRQLRPPPGSIRGAATWLLTLSTSTVSQRGRTCGVSAELLVRGDERWSRLRWQQSVTVLGRLSPMPPADRSAAALLPLEPPTVTAPAGPLARGAERARAGLRAAVAPLPADARGLLPGLVLGDTSLTPVDLTQAMTTTGMTHLSAVSGDTVAKALFFTPSIGPRSRHSRRTRRAK